MRIHEMQLSPRDRAKFCDEGLRKGINKYFIALALVSNIATLSSVCYILARRPNLSDLLILNTNINLVESLLSSVSVYCFSWIIVNFLAGVLLCLTQFFSDVELKRSIYLDSDSSWKTVGTIIISVRVLHIATGVLNNRFGTKVCFTIDAAFDDGSFYVPFVIMMIDVRLVHIIFLN